MLKTGRACLRGHRMEFCLMQLFLCLCWLIPIAAEMAIRRLLPAVYLSKPQTEAGILLGGILLNRLLVAPAHCGYAGCCYHLARNKNRKTASTCEFGDLPVGIQTHSLLRIFWREYCHPILRLRRQLRWDLLRLVTYGAAVFPGLLLIVIGAGETTAFGQFFWGISGLLLAAVGLFWMYCGLRRFLPTVYLPEKYPTFLKAIIVAQRQTRHHRGAVVLRAAVALVASLASFFPFVLLRAEIDLEYAVFFQRLPPPENGRKRLFQTRTLRT